MKASRTETKLEIGRREERSLKQGFQVSVGHVGESDRHVDFTASLSDEGIESSGAGSGTRDEVELLWGLSGNLVESNG